MTYTPLTHGFWIGGYKSIIFALICCGLNTGPSPLYATFTILVTGLNNVLMLPNELISLSVKHLLKTVISLMPVLFGLLGANSPNKSLPVKSIAHNGSCNVATFDPLW